MKNYFLVIILFFFCTNSFCQNDIFNYEKTIAEANQSRIDEQFKKAADLYTKAFKLNNDKGKVYDRYLCAICWAKLKITDSVIVQLDRIATSGKFTHHELVESDEAFFYLHDDKRFLAIINKMKENYRKLK